MAKGTKRQECSHYLLDGFSTGNLFVPLNELPALMDAMLEDIEYKRRIFFVELPRAKSDMGSLVLDVDFKRFCPTVKDALAFGRVVIEQVMDCINWSLVSSIVAPMPGVSLDTLQDLATSALISMCDEGPNMHIAFPSCRLSQEEAVKLLCTLPELLYRRRQSIQGFENVSRPELETILDMCVVTCNGVRMNGSYKCATSGADVHLHSQSEKRVYRPFRLYLHDRSEAKKHKMLGNLDQKFSRGFLHRLSTINSSPYREVVQLKMDMIKKGALNVKRYDREMAKLAASEAREVSESGSALQMLGVAGVAALESALVELGYDRPPRIADVHVSKLVTEAVGGGRRGDEIQITFDRKDELSRKCFNYGKTHKSNPTYCVLNMCTMELSQRCRCPCRDKTGLKTPCQEYVSAPVVLDISPESLPAVARSRMAASDAARPQLVAVAAPDDHVAGDSSSYADRDILVPLPAAKRNGRSTKKDYATWRRADTANKRKLTELESQPYDPLQPIMASGLTVPFEAQGMCRESRKQLLLENRPQNRMGLRAIISPNSVNLELVIPAAHPDFRQLGGAVIIAHYARVIVNPKTLLPPLLHEEDIPSAGVRGAGEQAPEGTP